MQEFLPAAKQLVALGFSLFGTEGTVDFYSKHGIPMKLMHKASSTKQPNILEAIKNNEVDLLINIPRKVASLLPPLSRFSLMTSITPTTIWHALMLLYSCRTS